jgi:hypothetical protein
MDIKVYDYQGNQRDLAYLKAKYGDFTIQAAAAGEGPVYHIAVLREVVNAPASLVVRVSDEGGQPLEGVRVAFYWPDAPQDGDAGPLGGVIPARMRPNRCVSGVTSGSGDTGFGMGHGAYYWPDQGQTGPHAVWIHGAGTRSDLVLGLGMLAATNHDHFDVEYTRFEGEPDDGDGDDGDGDGDDGDETPPCPADEIEAELAKIEAAVAAIRQLLG